MEHESFIELIRLAEAASSSWLPGSWHNEYTLNGEEPIDKEDASYIAAMSPDVALQLLTEREMLLEACKKFMSGISILNDGPDESDEKHAHNILVESFTLARAAISQCEGKI